MNGQTGAPVVGGGGYSVCELECDEGVGSSDGVGGAGFWGVVEGCFGLR